MPWRPRLNFLRSLLPWLGVVAFALWAARPMLMTEGQVFAGRLATDNVVTPWFYDLVARQLEAGQETDWLTGIRHPNPHPRTLEFPSDWDARLVAPLSWWVDWPRSWGLVQAAALIVNGLGAALLARGLGARGIGVLVAGILGVVCRPVWKDLIMARMNAAFPGLALGALGTWIWVLRSKGSAPFPTLLALGLGVAGSLVYPPYIALLIPFGVVFGLAPLVQASNMKRLQVTAIACAVVALAYPVLEDIASAGLAKAVACQDIACPTIQNAVTWDRIFIWTPDWRQGLSLAGSAGASLLLWPLLVVHRRRFTGLVASLGVGALLFLALGPCASWTAGDRIDVDALPFGWDLWLHYVSCKLEPLHDYNRLLTLGVMLAGVLGGLGVEACWGNSTPSWTRTLRRLVVGSLVIAIIGQAQWVVLSEALSPTKWHEAPLPAVARHIQKTPVEDRGPVLELPFDRSAQFLSILAEPSVPRGNPLRPTDPPPRQDRFWRWAYAMGNGQSVETVPDAHEVRASGVRWVYFDEDRCPNATQGACAPSVTSSLRRVLGVPKRVGSLQVWSIE